MREQAGPLTDTGFWDDFWQSTRLPALPDPAKPYDACFIELFDRFLKPDPAKSVFEAGCAPGSWLSHFHKRYGYRLFGCETSPRGAAATRENFRLNSASGEIYERDFLELSGVGPFDVVLSLGFLEHFKDPMPVARKHVELVKPGGLLFLEVPNLTSLNAWLVTPELMSVHNQGVMTRTFFEELARREGLETLYLGYFGGFEPDLLGPPRDALAKRAVLKGLRLVSRLPGARGIQNPAFSAFLGGVFRKPG